MALAVLLFGIAWSPARPAPTDKEEVERAIGRVYHCEPGPWGDLEYSRVMIEPPEEFLASDYVAPPTRWNFAGFDEARLEQLWRQAGLDDRQLKAVRDPVRREVDATGIVLKPDDKLVRGLSPESRATIYNVLAQLPDNLIQTEPFRFRAEMLDEWFADSAISAEVVAQIRSLLYRRGSALLFSDPSLVLPSLPAATDRVRLVKTLSRKTTLLVKIRLQPDSDIETIANCWSTGRRRKDVRPLLYSLSRHQGGMTIDLAHLLPRLPRGLLYTYPSPEVPRERSPDCHWTSMNFFNDTPDERFDDIDYLKVVLMRDYAEVQGPPAMGDVIVLSRPNGEVVHSCVYIAADIVFTKNGQSHTVPWTLSTLPDLQAFYPANAPLQIRFLRRK
jgi:hypothetical protein